MKNCYACGGSVEGYAKGGDVRRTVDGEKGVHAPSNSHRDSNGKDGVSMAGRHVRNKTSSGTEEAKRIHKQKLGELKGQRRDRKNLAEGGFVEDEEMSGYPDMPSGEHQDDYDYPEDIVGEIMMDRAEGYSEGGKVANDTSKVDPDSEHAQYDDLVLRDDLEFSYTGNNSGDKLGDESLDDEEQDMIDEIMKERKKRPA